MKYVLGLGSNDGYREAHLRRALNALAEHCDSLYSSTHYASPALGGGKSHYLNAVAIVDCLFTQEKFENWLKELEESEGRDSEARKEGRVPLDVDIVISEGEIVRPSDFRQYFFRRGYEELQSLGLI